MGSDLAKKISQESPIPSVIDKTDSFTDLQQSTERDLESFVSQTESKVYSKDSKHRSDSLDETSQFSDLEDQMGTSPAQRPLKIILESVAKTGERHVEKKETSTRDQTLEFLKYENEFSSQTHAPALAPKDSDKVSQYFYTILQLF